ncbi:MAG: cupin domain-containing protein [Lamprocystis purpurea]|jgi:cupin 2 domain-containing protein|uniref:cupin domain-containing protein n=1 Tax=Lamprocystis purpurea TaxID=61598 RepID=UPI00037F48B1|nr:cupin domain-containing protein [Lamprocystis purpurea]MBV5272836.1 cupin domain-containing protein [Lamprocystis purpurea]
MLSRTGNLFALLPGPATGEIFEELLRLELPAGRVWIERIVSSPFPEPVLYDQPQSEWVILLQGEARLWVAGEERMLVSGDYLFIPAHTPHRVVETSAEPQCIWLAVHLEGGGS